MHFSLFFILITSLTAFPIPKNDVTYSACENKYDGCNEWKKSGMCDMNQYKDYMTMTCPVACGFCSQNQIAPEEPRSPSAEVQTATNTEAAVPSLAPAPVSTLSLPSGAPVLPSDAPIAPSLAPASPLAVPAAPLSPYNPQVDSAPYVGPKTTVDFIGPIITPASPLVAGSNPVVAQAYPGAEPSTPLDASAPLPQPEPQPVANASADEGTPAKPLATPTVDDGPPATNELENPASKNLEKLDTGKLEKMETVEGSGSGEANIEENKTVKPKPAVAKQAKKLAKKSVKKLTTKLTKKVPKKPMPTIVATPKAPNPMLQEDDVSGSGDDDVPEAEGGYEEAPPTDLQEDFIAENADTLDFDELQDTDFETLISTDGQNSPFQLRSEIAQEQAEQEESGEGGSGSDKKEAVSQTDAQAPKVSTDNTNILGNMLKAGAAQAYSIKRVPAVKGEDLSPQVIASTPNIAAPMNAKPVEQKQAAPTPVKAASRHELGGEGDVNAEEAKDKLKEMIDMASGTSGSGIDTGLLHLTLRQVYNSKYGSSDAPAYQILAGNFKKDMQAALKLNDDDDDDSLSDITFSETDVEGNPRTTGRVRVNFKLKKNADKLKELVDSGNINGLLVVKNSLEGMTVDV